MHLIPKLCWYMAVFFFFFYLVILYLCLSVNRWGIVYLQISNIYPEQQNAHLHINIP